MQHNIFKIHEKFSKQKFYDKFVKLNDKARKNDDFIIIITTNDFYDKYVKYSTITFNKLKLSFDQIKINEQ